MCENKWFRNFEIRVAAAKSIESETQTKAKAKSINICTISHEHDPLSRNRIFNVDAACTTKQTLNRGGKSVAPIFECLAGARDEFTCSYTFCAFVAAQTRLDNSVKSICSKSELEEEEKKSDYCISQRIDLILIAINLRRLTLFTIVLDSKFIICTAFFLPSFLMFISRCF